MESAEHGAGRTVRRYEELRSYPSDPGSHGGAWSRYQTRDQRRRHSQKNEVLTRSMPVFWAPGIGSSKSVVSLDLRSLHSGCRTFKTIEEAQDRFALLTAPSFQMLRRNALTTLCTPCYSKLYFALGQRSDRMGDILPTLIEMQSLQSGSLTVEAHAIAQQTRRCGPTCVDSGQDFDCVCYLRMLPSIIRQIPRGLASLSSSGSALSGNPW